VDSGYIDNKDYIKIKKGMIIAYIIIGVLFLINLSVSIVENVSEDEVSITITNLETRNSRHYSEYGVIRGIDGEGSEVAYCNKNTILRWKWNYKDIQDCLTVGNTYKIKVVGVSIPIINPRRNVIEVIE
jgi:hypothetical protein